MRDSVLIDELTWVDIRDRIAAGWETVIVPLGSTEQHGPALPLLTDNEHGVQTAVRAARMLGKTLVGPVVTLGYSIEHTAFPGTVSLSKNTLAGVIHDVAESHARSGFKLVYFWLGHGGNNPILQEVLPTLETKWPGCRVTGIRDLSGYISATWGAAPLERGIPLAQSGSHAGEFETSMMLAARPELVQMNAAEKGCEAPFDSIAADMFALGIQSVSANGVLGDQRPADAARGAYYLEKLAEYLVQDIQKEMGQIKGRGEK
jgi:creatinine amidohydrolase